MQHGLDILVICAHPDDAEISVGGTLIRYVNEGFEVGVADLTMGELGTRGSGPLRLKEADRAANMIGLKVRENLNLGDGTFQNDPQTRSKVIACIRKHKPRIVLTNAPGDRHPDHGRAAQLVGESCFFSGLTKIETELDGTKQNPWRPKALYHFIQDYYIEPDFVMDIEQHWDKKVEVLKSYSSQFYNPDSNEPSTPISGDDFFEFLKSRSREMGRAAGFKLAEGFVAARRIGVKDFFDLH
ncbi:MAG: bacillithiol biosynthesis deacetylase BshB1 [Flavobacteriales bacterium]|nr:bacillithiol biosynthesis deacetylase BshB1 [Flavobacteriales bacterium]